MTTLADIEIKILLLARLRGFAEENADFGPVA